MGGLSYRDEIRPMQDCVKYFMWGMTLNKLVIQGMTTGALKG
jgi:hypothetical protein